MSSERPNRENLRRGMMVEIEQSSADDAADAEPIRGENKKCSKTAARKEPR